MHRGILPVCISVHHMHAWCLWMPLDLLELMLQMTYGCWELNLGLSKNSQCF